MTGQAVLNVDGLLPADDALRARVDAFSSRHDLTCAEANVLGYVVLGMDLPAISRVQGRTHATVKTHVSNIFSKTYTRRQSELVSVFFRT
jgi:DNA-binding CsgD family transcriptional regulator